MADNSPKIVIGSEASSRFTRTPIKFGKAPPRDPESSGRFDRGPNRISVSVPLSGDDSGHAVVPDWADFNNTIHHEDIHALLDAAGARGKPLDQDLLRIPPNKDGVGVEQFLPENWGMSKRGGGMNNELPAYLGAYREGLIKDITPESAASWITRYAGGLPEGARKTLSRIQSSNDASQRGLPTGSVYSDPAKFRYKGATEK